MRRSAVAVLPLVAAALVFVACSERESTSPRLPSGASFSATLTPAASCDFTQIDKARRAYFTSSRDTVIGLINQMQAAPAGATRNPIAWQILHVVAAERLSSLTAASSDGAVFVNDVLRCTSYTFPPTANSDVQQGFLDNLALVLSAGIFNVRGTGFATDAAAALDGSPQVFALPRWGVEAVSAWPAGPALIWGFPELIANVALNPATNINTNGSGTYNGFELGTIPDATPKDGLRVGVCYQSTTNGTTANRLVHNNSEILVNNTPGALCTMPSPVASTNSRSWYVRALARAATLLVPADAHAMQGGDFIGGLPSSWSPFASGALLGSNIAPTFTVQPNDAVVGGNVHAVVNVTINGLPVPGVDLTVSIDNNQGVPAGAVITSGDPSTHATTDRFGNATFDITVGKPGGYLISVGGNLTGVTTGGTLSAQFHIKNP
jgi:hypothetical protein